MRTMSGTDKKVVAYNKTTQSWFKKQYKCNIDVIAKKDYQKDIVYCLIYNGVPMNVEKNIWMINYGQHNPKVY